MFEIKDGAVRIYKIVFIRISFIAKVIYLFQKF